MKITRFLKSYQSFVSIGFVILLSLIAILPFFQKGFFPIHDNTQVARVFQMHKALEDGLFPVRWVADLGYGYGYPIFNFYAPFAYYLGAIFMFVGFKALIATKIMIALGVVASGITMYFFARKMIDDSAGAVIAAILYVYAPYHAVNTYVRGAIGEVWAYVFIPLVFYGFSQLFLTIKEESSVLSDSSTLNSQNSKSLINNKKLMLWIAVSSLAYAALILSHNLTALIVTFFLVILFFIFKVSLFRQKKLYGFRYLLYAFFLGLSLSAFYWVPAIGEMKYTNVISQTQGGSVYKDHFVCFSQLWNSQWGFGGSTNGCLDGLSFQLGKIHVILGIVGVISAFLLEKKHKGIVLVFLSGLLLSLFFMLEISKPLWDLFPFMKYLQFPWRFLQIALFFLSFLGGIGFAILLKKVKCREDSRWLGLLGVMLFSFGIVVFYSKLFKPQLYYHDYRDETKREVLLWTISKISDEYLPADIAKPQKEIDVPSDLVTLQKGAGNVQVLENKTGYKRILFDPQEDMSVQLHLATFPAWQFYKNNRREFVTSEKGVYTYLVPRGEKQTLVIQFVQTPLEKIANTISIISAAVLTLGIIRKKVPFLL